MDNPRLIFYLLLYVVFISSSVAVFATNMGVPGYDVNTTPVNFTPPEQGSFISGIPVIGETVDSASMVSSLLFTIINVLVWTLPENIFPLWANLVFIKIPLILLLAAILDLVLP